MNNGFVVTSSEEETVGTLLTLITLITLQPLQPLLTLLILQPLLILGNCAQAHRGRG
jgi:hypothetical protein